MVRRDNSTGIEQWLRLIRTDGVGPKTFARLLERFGSVDKALGASVSELSKIEGIGFKTVEKIAAGRDKFDVEKELALAEKLDVWMINWDDVRYPPALKAIYDPPPVLYIKGTLERCDALSVAVVGCRQCSTYGSEQASRFGYLLAAAGFTVVSGMARGIDSAAHRGALSCGGRTIAVQGCGLGRIFPPENDRLFEKIAESGAVVSELPLSYEPLSENFPGRNRIIAGLAMAVVVVEASAGSGALITAKSALANNREVLAVPGKIDSPLSIGSNRLIKEGAAMITSFEDILEAIGHVGREIKEYSTSQTDIAEKDLQRTLFEKARPNLADNEVIVFEHIERQPVHVEQIIQDTGLTAGRVGSLLIALRLKGLIKQLPGNMFVRVG